MSELICPGDNRVGLCQGRECCVSSLVMLDVVVSVLDYDMCQQCCTDGCVVVVKVISCGVSSLVVLGVLCQCYA